MADVLGANRLGPRVDRAPHAVILNYHRIAEPADDPLDREIISATPDEFAAQLDFLHANFDCLTLAELEDLITADPGGVAGGRRVVLTFDDGYADNAAIAAPLLRRRGLPATFFITTGFIDGRRPAWWDEIAWILRAAAPQRLELPEFGLSLDLAAGRAASIRQTTDRYKAIPPQNAERLLDAIADRTGAGRMPQTVAVDVWMRWDDIRRLQQDGFDIGGHTVSHPVLARLPEDQQAEEVTGCFRRLLEELGRPPHAFSYPVGQPDSFTPQSRQAVAAAGFGIAFSFYGGVARAGHVDRYNVPRFAVDLPFAGSVFRSRVAWPQLFA